MSVVNDCKTFNEENTINEKCFKNILNTEFGNNNITNNNNNNKQVTRAPPVWLTDENDESSYSPIKNNLSAVTITRLTSHDSNLEPKLSTGTTKISKLIYEKDEEKIKKQKTVVRSRHTYKTDYINEINNITPSFSRSILVNSPSAVLTSPKSSRKSTKNSPRRLEDEFDDAELEEAQPVEKRKSANKIAKLIMNTVEEDTPYGETVLKKKSETDHNLIQFEQQNITDFSLVFNNANKSPKKSYDINATSNEFKLNLENIIPTTRVNMFNQNGVTSPVIPIKKIDNYPTKPMETEKTSADVVLKSNKSTNNEKLKPHDRIETRRYMKEQQKKRAQVYKNDNQKDQINKDIIKERLSKLKMNTRKIVNKNVKKTTQKPETNENPTNQNDVGIVNDEKPAKKSVNEKTPVKKPKEIKKPEEQVNLQEDEKKNKILHLSPYFKRKFGILRRQEDDLEPFTGQIKLFETESRTANVGTTPMEAYIPDKIPPYNANSQNNSLIMDKSVNPEPNPFVTENLNTDLRVPEVKLNVNKTLPSDITNKNNEIPVEEVKDDLPFWLRPSAVQIYPYNFIMAVRKKLEAITNPVITHHDEKTQNTTNDDYKLKLKKLLDNADKKMLQSMKSEKMLHDIANIPSLSKNKMDNRVVVDEQVSTKTVVEENYIKSSSGCGMTTNFSSISLNMPQSNTVSDISSIKSDYLVLTSTPLRNLKASKKIEQNTSMELDAGNNSDDTDDTLRTTDTISSVIFSYENNLYDQQTKQQPKDIEEKLPKTTLSPLSITNIADMRIKSNFLIDSSKQEEEVTTSIDEILLIEKQERKTKEYRNEEVQTENIQPEDDLKMNGFHKMLEAFNQSLSHVIEVNQQLYSALHGGVSKTNNVIQSTKDNENTNATVINLDQTLVTTRSIAYTDDFEQQVNSQDEFVNLATEEKENLNKTLTSNEFIEEDLKTVNSAISTKSDIKSRSDSKTNTKQINEKLSSESIKTNSNKENNSGNSNGTQFTDYVTRDNGNNTNRPHEDIQELFIQTEKSLIFNDEHDGGRYLNTSISNLSIGSDIFAIFNQKTGNGPKTSDHDVSSFLSATTILSETNLSYSNIGMYEKMITTEKTKTEHLTYLMKLREKSIIDRTKGQLAWLELQKIKLKEKSLGNEEIKIIKKKQRALLVRLEKERNAIKREMKLQTDGTLTTNTPKKHLLNTSIDDLSTRVVSLKRSLALKLAKTPSKAAMKGYEIIGDKCVGNSLERILEKREQELRERREHVENLIKWHQRLDNEEQQVIEIENLLMGYNVRKLNNKTKKHSAATPAVTNSDKNLLASPRNENEEAEKKKLQKKLNKIEKSLKILKNISTTSIDDDDLNGDVSNVSSATIKSKVNEDYVRTSGERMNKLWLRLTNRNEKRFERKKIYKFNKGDLEDFYEEAKKVIFYDFFQMNNSKDTASNTLNSITNLCTEISDVGVTADVITAVNNDLVATQENPNGESRDVSLLNLNVISEEVSHKSEENDYNYYFTSEASERTVESAKTETTPTITNRVRPDGEAAVISEDISRIIDDDKEEIPKELSIIVNDTNGNISEEMCDNQNETFTYTTPTISTITDVASGKTETLETISEHEVTVTDRVEETPDLSAIQNTDGNLNKTIILNEIKTFELNIKNLEEVEEILYSNSDRSHRDTITDSNESTELEKRLINIDDSLKNLNETFEKVPIMDFDGKLLSPDSVLSLYSNKDIMEGLEEEGDEEEDDNENNNTFYDDEDTSEIKSIEITEENSIDEPTRLIAAVAVVTEDFNQTIDDDEDKENQNCNQMSPSTSSQIQNITMQRDYNNKKLLISNRMPDIISEAEVLRRQQQQIKPSDQDAKQIEQSGYVFLREIPNKPPPPYVPPAHGSPLTALFPSEERITEIIYRRAEELYNLECSNADTNRPTATVGSSILNENITNIYEKIILDVCYECFNDIDIQSISKHTKIYKNQLKFYNPPDKLKCIQEFILKRVKKLLNINSGSSKTGSSSPSTSNKNNLLLNNFNYNNNRRKRDHVDIILVDELFEDEHKWINYDIEEEIVLNNVIDEILKSLLHNTLIDVENLFNAKLLQQQMLS